MPLISYEGDKINAKALKAHIREAVDLNTSDLCSGSYSAFADPSLAGAVMSKKGPVRLRA